MVDNELKFGKLEEKGVVGSKPGILVLASGGGTNFQNIIDKVNAGVLNAQVVGLISDKSEAGALDRARRNGIPDILVSSEGRSRRNSPERAEFERELLEAIKDTSPDVVVLAGWMKILSDEFLVKMQQLGIPIINLHPALLTEGNEDSVETSCGRIPVIRGAHAIRDAYDMNLPVSGVTVHRVVPGPFDTGPIILQREVLRLEGDTLEDWEARIHQMEYQVLPEAISVMLAQIDTNNG